MKLIQLLREAVEIKTAKAKLNKIVNDYFDDKEEVLENDQKEKKEVMSKLENALDLVREDDKKVATLINFVETLAAKERLTTKSLDLFFKSDYGRRLLSKKALATKAPTRKNSKDLRIDNVETFEELTDDHTKDKGTTNVLKYIFKFIMEADVSVKDKDKFLEDISNPNNLIKASDLLKDPAIGNIKDLIKPSITSNPLYDLLEGPLFELNAKGVGKGEAFLMLYSADSGDAPSKKGDVVIEGKYFEIKNAKADASIDSGLSSKGKFNIDDYNEDFQKTELNLSDEDIKSINLQKGGKENQGTNMKFTHPLIQEKLTLDNLIKYFTKIYSPNGKGLSNDELSNLASDVLKASKGSEKDVFKALAPYVYKMYKSKKGFDGIVFIKPNGDYISFVNEVPNEIKANSAMFKRGGNNQSLPVGYINLTF